jgi:hypothetical protein
MQSRIDIAVGELEPGYRALVESIETGGPDQGPYRTQPVESLAVEYYPAGGRLGVTVGCLALGTVMFLIGGGSLAFVLALARQAIVLILALLAFGGVVATGIGLWTVAVREVLRTREAARRRLGVFLGRDALFVCEEKRCSLVPWSCVEQATGFSSAHEATDYVVVAYREEEDARPRTLRIRVPWRKGKLLRRMRRRAARVSDPPRQRHPR